MEAVISAWHNLTGGCIRRARIRVLKEAPKVYRLCGAAPGEANVVAKRCSAETAAVEAVVYENILAHQPLSALQFYGMVPDNDCKLCWIFLEDAGDDPYQSDREEHRVMAGKWLSTLHSAAVSAGVAASLPDRTVGFYLKELRSAVAAIVKTLDRPALSADDCGTLQSIVSDCNSLEELWKHMQDLLAPMPMALVHGDMAERNLRIRDDGAGSSLLVFDWGKAGWGVPAADLKRLNPDLIAYESAARSWWPALSTADLQRLVKVGDLFRLITSLVWAVPSTWAAGSEEGYMQLMRCYQPRLEKWARAGEFALS
jgi:hypothetical protein